MTPESQYEEMLLQIAKTKYVEACSFEHGVATGRRLELAGYSLTAEELETAVVKQFVDIARRIGAEFLLKTPGVALEQFAIMAIMRNQDTAGLLKSLINSFLVAYMTPETSERAFTHLVGLESLRAEVKASRTAPADSSSQAVH